jgi:hypothetical protein
MELSEISNSDVALIANVYNDIVGRIDPFRYRLDMRGDFTKKLWYNDVVQLIRLMTGIGAKPRIYIQAQITEYRKPMFKSRQLPTIRQMASPAGIDRYNKYCEERNTPTIKPYVVTEADMMSMSKIQMDHLMKRLNIETEELFFKDIYLVNQLSRVFVKKHPVFQQLVKENYYLKQYGIDVNEMLY